MTITAATTPGGWTLTGSIKLGNNLSLADVQNRSVVLPDGTTYNSSQTIPVGTILPVGTVINVGAAIQMVIPGNSVYGVGTRLPGSGTAPLPVGTLVPRSTDLAAVMGAARVTLQAGQTLASGAILPTGTTLISLTPIANHAGAPMLAPGSQSWSIRLVSGADRQSADTRAVQSLSALGAGGNMLLSNSLINAAGKMLPSVIRTGTGDLDLIAGRDLTQDTPFGVYTAGTQIDVGGAYSGITSQGGYFTENGGDLTITTGRNLTGYLYVDGPSSGGAQSNYSVGNWLVRQGDAATPAAWGIRFGRYGGPSSNIFLGFSGFGALGGGNLAADVGGDAGVLGAVAISQRPDLCQHRPRLRGGRKRPRHLGDEDAGRRRYRRHSAADWRRRPLCPCRRPAQPGHHTEQSRSRRSLRFFHQCAGRHRRAGRRHRLGPAELWHRRAGRSASYRSLPCDDAPDRWRCRRTGGRHRRRFGQSAGPWRSRLRRRRRSRHDLFCPNLRPGLLAVAFGHRDQAAVGRRQYGAAERCAIYRQQRKVGQ